MASTLTVNDVPDLQRSAPADVGYPWVDKSGSAVIGVSSETGRRQYENWRPSASASKASQRTTDSSDDFVISAQAQ